MSDTVRNTTDNRIKPRYLRRFFEGKIEKATKAGRKAEKTIVKKNHSSFLEEETFEEKTLEAETFEEKTLEAETVDQKLEKDANEDRDYQRTLRENCWYCGGKQCKSFDCWISANQAL